MQLPVFAQFVASGFFFSITHICTTEENKPHFDFNVAKLEQLWEAWSGDSVYEHIDDSSRHFRLRQHNSRVQSKTGIVGIRNDIEKKIIEDLSCSGYGNFAQEKTPLFTFVYIQPTVVLQGP